VRPAVFEPVSFPDHALLDSGAGWKLERYGPCLLARPDPQALWRRRLEPGAWERADLSFVRESDRGGRWEARSGFEPPPAQGWSVRFGEARFWIRPTSFKHVGLFPEQAANWTWMQQQLAGLEQPRVLNLFAYTGVASLLAARRGAQVTHVDASRSALAWARENAELSGITSGLRWVLEDALAFARREARRGARYEGILLDPPHYGRGPKGEKWQFESGLAPLVEACGQLLAERGFLILSSYAVGYSALAFANLLGELEGGAVEAAELVLAEQGPAAGDATARLLPCGFAARWSRGLGT